MTAGRSTRQRAVLVLCPHFEPDTAPTGTVMTRIVKELAERGRTVHVVSSLPWYRHHSIESGWGGRLVRRELTEWGSITRVHPFPGDDRRNLLRRAFGFLAYSLLAGWQALRVGRSFSRAGAVIAMSPPLTLGLTGWIVARVRRAPLVFNIQDVFPDAAVETGAVVQPRRHRAGASPRTLELPGRRRGDGAVRGSAGQRGRQTRTAGSATVCTSFRTSSTPTRSFRRIVSTAYRERTRSRRRPDRAVRRQRRLLAVARVVAGGGAGTARRAVPDQRRRSGPFDAGGPAEGLPNVHFGGYSNRNVSARCWRPGTSTWSR